MYFLQPRRRPHTGLLGMFAEGAGRNRAEPMCFLHARRTGLHPSGRTHLSTLFVDADRLLVVGYFDSQTATHYRGSERVSDAGAEEHISACELLNIVSFRHVQLHTMLRHPARPERRKTYSKIVRRAQIVCPFPRNLRSSFVSLLETSISRRVAPPNMPFLPQCSSSRVHSPGSWRRHLGGGVLRSPIDASLLRRQHLDRILYGPFYRTINGLTYSVSCRAHSGPKSVCVSMEI